MNRIILHWTAGTNKASKLDKQHYHFIVEGDGTVVAGDLPPEANLSTKDGTYAAHTLNCNTGSIGVALAAMAGAREAPFTAGRFPITPQQPKALARLVAKLCQSYSIPVTRETVLTHAEVQPTLKIAQRGKWDITWLPGMSKPEGAVQTGDWLRGLIKAEMPAKPPATPTSPPTAKKPGSVAGPAAIGVALTGLFAAFAAYWEQIKAWFGG